MSIELDDDHNVLNLQIMLLRQLQKEESHRERNIDGLKGNKMRILDYKRGI